MFVTQKLVDMAFTETQATWLVAYHYEYAESLAYGYTSSRDIDEALHWLEYLGVL